MHQKKRRSVFRCVVCKHQKAANPEKANGTAIVCCGVRMQELNEGVDVEG